MEELATISHMDTLLRLILSIVLGGIIGLERELHRREAGLRTHILVCMGSTVLIIAAQKIYAGHSGAGTPGDPGRIAAGIITGIGFLGGGAILRAHETIRGLTTAASIWLVAGLGIVIGQGLYVLAVETTMLAVFVLLILRLVERSLKRE